MENILSATPVLIYASSIYSLFFVEDKKIQLLFIIGLFLLNTLLNPILKNISFYFFKDNEIFQRPNPPKQGCGCFANLEMNGSKSFGFPSGHAQIVAFTAMFYTLYFGFDPKILFFWIYGILVCIQRINIGCHNLFQVFGGSIIGIILAIVYHKVIYLFY